MRNELPYYPTPYSTTQKICLQESQFSFLGPLVYRAEGTKKYIIVST